MKTVLKNNSDTFNLHPDFAKTKDYTTSEYSLSIRKMTHEINNALTLINSSLQIIESSHPEVKTFKYWDTTMDDIHYLINLVSEISYFNNTERLCPESTNLMSLIQNTVNSFNAYENAENMEISVKTLNHIPNIQCDRIKLKQVLINLIKNAYEAIEQKNSFSYIHISVKSNEEKVFIRIEDNGCGIKPEQLDNIFFPMVSYKANGTGLGLPISKKIIEAHSGTISVESSSNTGTTFIITLPA